MGFPDRQAGDDFKANAEFVGAQELAVERHRSEVSRFRHLSP